MFELMGARVTVTGGTGFLGRHVADELASRGAVVSAVRSGDYDLRRRAAIDRMLSDTAPDAVVHAAGVVGGIGANRAEPGRFFYENALMGIELLEACRVAAVAKVVVAGTVCSYPEHCPVPFRESSLWDGHPEPTNAAYGLAKKMLLVQARAYREQYGSNIVTLLPTNLYGPGDRFDLVAGHVIPAMIQRFSEARDAGLRDVVLWGDGSPTREFLYASDAAGAFALALERYDDTAPLNIGSGTEVSMRELARLVAELTGFDGEITWDASMPNGQARRRLDSTRAHEALGFRANTPLRDGLEATIAWFSSAPADAGP